MPSNPRTAIPPNNVICEGHNPTYDVYRDSDGNIWIYSGSNHSDWHNPKYWKRVS